MSTKAEVAGLTLFRAEEGGAVYWVAAVNAEDCRALVQDCHDDPIHADFKVRPVTQSEISLLRLPADDGMRLGPGSMYQAFAETSESSVIACSEWP